MSSGPKAQELPSHAAAADARLSGSPWNEILVAAALFASACLSIWLTRAPGNAPGGIALLWPGSAIAAALLIRMPRVRWGLAAVAVPSAVMLANLLAAHRPWPDAFLLAGVNAFEVALMVVAFRFIWAFPYPNLTIGHAAVMTAIFGIGIPGLAAIGGGTVLHLRADIPFWEGAQQWWSSHAIGACLLGPPIILFSVKKLKRLTRPRYLASNILMAAAGLFGCYLAIRFVRFPFVWIGLLLMIESFRLGGFGTSLMSLAFGFLITNLWLVGIRPLGLDAATPLNFSLEGLPVAAFLAAVMPAVAVGLGSDARRLAARALRESERRFRESMEHSPIGMLIADLDGVWGYTNIVLQQMLGRTAAQLHALPPGGPSKPEDWKDSEASRQRLLAGEIDVYDVTCRFLHQEGHWIWAHMAVSLLRDDEGLPLHLVAQIESLEARQRAEEKLAEERERLKITLESIEDAVITTDAQTRITYLNTAAESLLCLDLEAVQSRRVDEVIHLMDPESFKTAANLIGQSSLHARVFKREHACLLHRTDGTVCFVTDTVSPVLDTTGLVTGLVIVLRDATVDVSRTRDLHYRAMHDSLTGLYNRTEFEHQLKAVFNSARHLNRPAAVIAIDLDRFKALNDTAGHAAGDAMLRKVAETCLEVVRSSDTVARLGGDEFAVILPNCPLERATLIGRKLLNALNSLEIDWLGSRRSIGASMGLSMCSSMPDEKTWLEAADGACYRAKRNGRGRLESTALNL